MGNEAINSLLTRLGQFRTILIILSYTDKKISTSYIIIQIPGSEESTSHRHLFQQFSWSLNSFVQNHLRKMSVNIV